MKLADNADATERSRNSLTSMDENLDVGGAASRACDVHPNDRYHLVIVGLLAVSVLVALVGVANTLSLSVFKRNPRERAAPPPRLARSR